VVAATTGHVLPRCGRIVRVEPTPREPLPYTDADVAEATGRLRAIVAALPEVTERLSHGAVTFFVRGKRTLTYLTDDHHGDGRLALVYPAPDGVQAEVLASDPERFFRPPYVGHRGWVGLRLDVEPDWDEVADVVDEAYRCVAPRRLVAQLDARDQADAGFGDEASGRDGGESPGRAG
jgi:hypothetical protein